MNLLKVSEAMQKICCHDLRSDCVADRCMAWRFAPDRTQPPGKRCITCDEDPGAIAEPARPGHVPGAWAWFPADDFEGEPAGWVESDAEYRLRRFGFCGLAGVPHELEDTA